MNIRRTGSATLEPPLDPPEIPEGHYEYDRGDDGEMVRTYVKDYDESDNPIRAFLADDLK